MAHLFCEGWGLPGRSEFLFQVTLRCAILARGQRLAEAVSEYQQAVKLQPGFSRAQLDLGLLLARQGDLRSATEHLRKAAAGKDPDVVRQAAQALQRISNQ